MSEKRQKKDGSDKKQEESATREKRPRKPLPGTDEDSPDESPAGVAGTDVKAKPGVRGIA